MDKRAMVLVVLIMVSALSVITLRQESRMTFAQLQTLERERDSLDIEWGQVIFDKVAVPKNDILGEIDKGWPILKKVLMMSAVAKSAEMVGAAQKVLEMAAKLDDFQNVIWMKLNLLKVPIVKIPIKPTLTAKT